MPFLLYCPPTFIFFFLDTEKYALFAIDIVNCWRGITSVNFHFIFHQSVWAQIACRISTTCLHSVKWNRCFSQEKRESKKDSDEKVDVMFGFVAHWLMLTNWLQYTKQTSKKLRCYSIYRKENYSHNEREISKFD